MTRASGIQPQDEQAAYVAALWIHPKLCLAIFAAQVLTPAGRRLYEASGVPEQMLATLSAPVQGLLLTRPLSGPGDDGPLLLQYWRSHEDLERFGRTLPHTGWWAWFNQHFGQGVGFYHEVYQVRTAEAIYLPGTRPVGPALFCDRVTVASGEGRSLDRQQRFEQAVQEDAKP